MADPFDSNDTLPDVPDTDEFLVLEDAKISEEDRQEILTQIETVVERNQIPITEELFRIHPKKKGAVFPVLLNLVTLALVAGGVFFMFRFFQARQESLSTETRAYLSTEGRLIEELRKESEEALAEKEAEIGKIQDELAELDRQSRNLQENMEESIREREEELRRELEAELAAERERLQGQGVSQEDIEAQLQALEAERLEEFNSRIEEFRAEVQAELAQKEAELTRAREMAREILEQANEERARLEEETRQREAELREQFEEEREALESRSSEAEARLQELSELREREILINDQIIGSYANVIDQIQAGNIEAAGNSLEELKRFLQDPAIQSLPSIAGRKNVELFIIDNIQDNIETQAADTGAETRSLLDAANLVVTARNIVARADAAAEAGDQEEAGRLYRQALEAVPTVNRAFRSIRSIEENQTAGAIRGIVDEARTILAEGNREEALQLFRQAALMSAGVNEQLALDAVTGVERVYVLNNRDDVNALNEDIADLEETVTIQEQAIAELEDTAEKLRETIAEQEEAIALREDIVSRRDETIEELQSRIAENTETIEDLRGDIAGFEDEIGTKEEELAALQEELETAEANLSSADERMGELQDEIGSLEAEIAALESEVADLTEANRELSSEAASRSEGASSAEMQRLAEELEEKDTEIANLRLQVASLSNQLRSATSNISSNDAARLAAEARENVYQDILDFVGYLTGDKPSRFRREIEEKAEEDAMYRNAIEQIQELAETTIAVEDTIQTVETKLIGTIASVTAGRVVIEPLVNIPIPEESRILIKRRTSSGEVPIADGEVYSVAAGRISAKINERISPTRSPMVMDLVYMEVEE